jgi:uncharacterized protein YraI
MAIDLSLIDEEHVTLTGLNLRAGAGSSYKVLLAMRAGTILWPQQKIPSWVSGKLVTQEGRSASDWIKVAIAKPLDTSENGDRVAVTGYCWIGSEKNPTIASTKKDATV